MANSHETPREQAAHVHDPVITVDWLDALEILRLGDAYATTHHAAHTITKQPGLRVVLIALKPGGQMKEHHTDAPIAVQGLTGAVDFVVGDQTIRLTPGMLVAVSAGAPHSVVAVEESAILLTVGDVTHHATVTH